MLYISIHYFTYFVSNYKIVFFIDKLKLTLQRTQFTLCMFLLNEILYSTVLTFFNFLRISKNYFYLYLKRKEYITWVMKYIFFILYSESLNLLLCKLFSHRVKNLKWRHLYFLFFCEYSISVHYSMKLIRLGFWMNSIKSLTILLVSGAIIIIKGICFEYMHFIFKLHHLKIYSQSIWQV